MPITFQVLRCYKCLVFQVHQTKKSNKFECKLCGEKQSVKRHYSIGTAKDCRIHVQKLNGIRGEIDKLKENALDSDDDLGSVTVQSSAVKVELQKSKWSDYVDEKEEKTVQSKSEIDAMFINNTEVVLEVPKKRKKSNFKCPSLKMSAGNNIVDHNLRKDGVEKTFKQNNTCIDNNLEPMTDNILKKEINTPVLAEPRHIKMQLSVNKDIKENVPSKININSKWAQFVEEEGEVLEDEENLVFEQADVGAFSISQVKKEYEDDHDNKRNSHELFVLCNDSDLDNVLDI